jgi:hypothetical protein
MEFDFSELEELHKKTFNAAIKILTDHYDTYVQDEQAKLKALVQIKKEVEQFTNAFNRGFTDEQ